MTYQLRPEEDAGGSVLSVFCDVRARMPFVPALFKALASDPAALELAWLQARALYDDPRAAQAGSRLVPLARPHLAYRPSRAVRAAVAPFAAELPSLLLVVTSLGLSLEGTHPLRSPPPARLPDPEPLPETPVPEPKEEHLLYDDIRAVYGTEHVPSMYKALAAGRLLAESWGRVGPFLAAPEGRKLVADVEAAADSEARAFPEYAFFAAASARSVLGQFQRALPRNLVFAMAATSS
ncbi:MAG: hypothetical protein ACRDNC_07840 [Gaiellaceae bacterium]